MLDYLLGEFLAYQNEKRNNRPRQKMKALDKAVIFLSLIAFLVALVLVIHG